ncbi:MarC family protein [Botrimarina sp.]|uniref:MarC family protein n=1 Tax=Botrimarina sp. TaxID=2795802 RepID=UPI0032EFAC7B
MSPAPLAIAAVSDNGPSGVLSIALLLVLIMDPFGNMVVVNNLLSRLPPPARVGVIVREGAIAGVLLAVFALVGRTLLDQLGLTEPALSLAGGIVLFLIAVGMVFPAKRITDEDPNPSPLIVPIAMPFIAGPSAISMVILFAERQPPGVVAAAIALSVGATTLILALAPFLMSLLRRRGAVALERLMGIFLIVISVQMILDGVDAFLDSRAA